MPVRTLFRRHPFAVPMACIAAAAAILVSEASYWRSAATLDQLAAIQDARASIWAMQHGLLGAETAQRGYLITQREDYLAPYQASIRQVHDAMATLDQYYRQNPAASARLGQLHSLADTRLSAIAETIRLQQEGRMSSAVELIESGIGKEQMDAILRLGTELLAAESAQSEASHRDIDNTLLLSRVGVTLLIGTILVALFLYLRQNSALEQHQLEMNRRAQTERDRLEVEVGLRTTQLTELTHHLQAAREDERHRLARNLHDDLGALLTSAKLDAARIKSRLGARAPEALEMLTHLVSTLNSSIALGRRIIEDLRPSSLSNLGLVASLEILVGEFAQQTGVEAHCALEPVDLDANSELMVYRLVQEAITNITKYARARNVWVSLAERDGQAEIAVRDDGVGFDSKVKPASAYGLVGMRYRVEAEGGTLSVTSEPGHGTLIQARIPRSLPGTEPQALPDAVPN